MLVSHWAKAIAIFVHLFATAWVLSQCERLSRPAQSAGQAKAVTLPATGKHDGRAEKLPTSAHRKDEDMAPAFVSPEARRRAQLRKAHAEALAERRVRYQALEAELVELSEKDIPGVLAELAQAVVRYRNKLSDLQRLKKAEQWERETPVKEAHARARTLTEEWYKIDFEAQKEREGPTLHVPTEAEALTKRLQAFKRGEEGIEPFAASLAALLGKVPESLLLSAIDAIPRAVLPKNAYDPCRDPSACPKPFASPAETGLTARDIASGVRLCVGADSLWPVPLYPRPDFNAPAHVAVRPPSCRLTATGRVIDRIASGGSLWIEVSHESGQVGWAQGHSLRRQR